MLQLKDGFSGERAIVLPPMIVRLMEEDGMLSALHITDIGYYPKAEYHYRERLKPIDQNVLIYCVDGKGEYRIDGQHYLVSANQFFILPYGKPHSYAADKDEPWTIYWIHFKGILSMHYLPMSYAPVDVKPEIQSRISNRTNIFEEMFATLQNGYSIDNLRYSSCLLHYYLGTLKYIRQYRDSNKESTDGNGMVENVMHYMKENIERNLTLKDLTDYTGYSPSHFSSLFRQRTGHSPIFYFNLMKIQQACFMLDESNMKINQISYKLGITDTFYFSRLFNKIMGMSPRQYRNRLKG
ncbi:MAG: AraC family transcriptional regulator [Candidatus Cryptobacteroides sp.]